MPPKEGSIGQRLKQLREAAGLTQQELAVKAGLSVSNLSQIEQGQKEDPRVSTVLALAKAMGVSVTSLIGEDGVEEKPRPRKGR